MLTLAQDAGQLYLLWGFILLGAVLILTLIELFVPSGGLIAAVAGICGIGSIAAFFMHSATAGLLALSLYMVLTPIMLWAVFKFWINSPMAGRMILGGTELLREGDEDPLTAAEKARRERLDQLRQLIGAEGVTVTSLRPVGTVKIAGQRIDALAESGTIDANTQVIVTDIYDNQIKVRPARP